MPVNRLCPVFVVGVAENPSLHVFGFDHEDSVDGDHNMINLGGTIRGEQNYVVELSVDALIEKQPESQCYQRLTQPTFDHVFQIYRGMTAIEKVTSLDGAGVWPGT